MHEFIESRKKIFKDNSTKNIRNTQQDKTIFDTSDDIQAQPSTGPFIPPWLKNNLGLSQRINSSLDWSVCLPNFTNLETGSVSCKNEERITDPKDKSETESIYLKAETKQEGPKMTNIEQEAVFPDVEKLKDEERKILKILKQKGKIKKRFPNTGESGKYDASHLFEHKAKEVIENLTKKDSSDAKECEAKFLYLKSLNEKNPKLNQEEIRFIQKLKDESTKSNVEKFIEHIKENSSKRFYKLQDCVGKNVFENINDKKEEEAIRSVNDEGKMNEDKESLLSTDDENDIKRFSEFLSNNKNQDEKRKCLEEVRNYFERKRRTRLTKKRPLDESKLLNTAFQVSRKEEQVKEKPKPKEVFTLISGKDKKNKFGFYDEEIMEKAVNETLQKFVNLYHFHVSPTVMSSMRRNILRAIQSDSLESESSKTNIAVHRSLQETKIEKDFLVEKNETDLDMKGHQMCGCNNVDCANKEAKKRAIVETPEEHASKPLKESEVVENENTKRLKKELENFINSIQNLADVKSLKLQSVVLEKEQSSSSSSSKAAQFVYNFTKKSLEPTKTPTQILRKEPEIKPRKEAEVQTVQSLEVFKKNVKIQTSVHEGFEKCLQTEEKVYVSKDVQTENMNLLVKEVKEVTSSDVSPGLYRMVKSKEVGRFYLYPENMVNPSGQLFENAGDKEIDSEWCLKNKAELVKFLIKENNKRDKKKISKDGKIRFSKKTYLVATKESQSTDYQKVDKLKSSVSCLYFRKRLPCKSFLKSTTNIRSSEVLDSEPNNETVEDAPKENHLGCVWFWNGQKISPGCDLKICVENLVQEKIKELTNSENYKLQNQQKENIWAQQCFEKNLDEKNIPAVPTFKEDLVPKNSPLLLTPDCNSLQDECGNKEDIEKEKPEEEKSVRDVSTQNSQQIFLSLNIENLKSRKKFNSIGKNFKTKPKKRKFVLKSIRDTQRYALRQNMAGSSRERLENSKLFQSLNDSDTQENNSCTSSVTEVSSSSLTSDNLFEPPMPLIKDIFKIKEKEGTAGGDKIENMISAESHEVRTNHENENLLQHQSQNSTAERYQHWELIDSLLNRAPQRKRESFWKSIKEFVSVNLGKDINDDEAQEVCIEIEQDFPEKEQGKIDPAIMAKGHYKKNDDDVEVEIDLTLEDLEKILRRRRRKGYGQQLFLSNKEQKLAPSSCT